MESNVAPGLLLSMPHLHDPNFTRAVVLMVEHSDEGSFGLIVNHPSDLPAIEQCAPCHRPGETLAVAPGIALSTSPDLLRDIAEAPPSRVRFLLGYSGWGPGQLASEMVRGSWLHVEASPELVFDTPADEMWEAALRTLGIDPESLVPGVGVH